MQKNMNFLSKIKTYIKSGGLFSKCIVIFCIFYCVRIIEWSMNQFEESTSEPSTIITAGLAFFGGELLFLCLKRIFAKSDKKTVKELEDELQSEFPTNPTEIVNDIKDHIVG